MKKLKVLVVDDSMLMRRIISDMINEDQSIEVIDTAKNGRELMDKLSFVMPDVITLDVEMPRMNGVEVLSELKQRGINMEPRELKKIDAYFRATNYLSACQLYLLDNPLLKRKLTFRFL